MFNLNKTRGLQLACQSLSSSQLVSVSNFQSVSWVCKFLVVSFSLSQSFSWFEIEVSVNQYQSIGSNNSLCVSQFKSDSFNLSVLVSCFQSLTMFQTEVNSLTVKSVSFRKLVYIVFSQSVLVCKFQSVSFSTLLSFSQFLSVIF